MRNFTKNNICFGRTSRILVAVVTIMCGLSSAIVSYANTISNTDYLFQEINEKKVTLKEKDKPLRDILREIEKQSGVGFAFNESQQTAKLKSLTITATDVTVGEALITVLKGTGYTFNIVDNTVAIVPIKSATKSEAAQTRKRIVINGLVLDTKKQPIIGATIVTIDLNSKAGAISGEKGNFRISIFSDDKLEISYMGMKTQIYDKQLINGQNIIIVLEEEALKVEDVLVTGYQVLERKSTVGSYTTLKMDDIKIAGATNVAQMLQGQVAGMIVTNTSARVGATPKIQIRGQSTILGNHDPIWVVDGVIQSDVISLNSKSGQTDDLSQIIGNQVSWLNPEDIETITVLKDASATAIYGSRASNGVIVITTKKPVQGKINISYSGSMSVKPRATYDQFNYMNSQERVALSDESKLAGQNLLTGAQGYVYQNNVYDYLESSFINNYVTRDYYINQRARLETVNTDWLKLMTRTSVSQSHNLSIAGNSDKMSYRVSTGFGNNKGQEILNDGTSLSLMAAVTTRLRKNLMINFNLSGNISKTTGVSGNVNPLSYATTTSRAIPAFEEDGSPAQILYANRYRNRMFDNYLSFNAMNEFEQTNATSKSNNLTATLGLEWNIYKGLSYRLAGNYTINGGVKSTYQSEKSFFIAQEYRGYDYGTPLQIIKATGEYNAATLPYGGVMDTNYSNGESYNIQNQLFYNKTFNNQHRLNVMFGQETRSSQTTNYSNTMWGFLPGRGNLLIKPNIPTSGGIGIPADNSELGVYNRISDGRTKLNEGKVNFMSLFLTFAYSYKDKYVFNASARNDFANTFGLDVNKRIDPTYSFGFKWALKNEEFMKNRVKWVNALDLSVTYGIQGNALTSLSPELILRMMDLNANFQEFYSKIMRIPNKDLSWERTTNWNTSINGRFFNYLNLSADYYRRSSNAIISQDIPLENGLKSMDINGGIIHNQGVEVTLGFSPIMTKDFGLNISVNMSKNWNTSGKPTTKMVLSNYLNGISNSIIKEGYPLGSFWRYSFAGLDPTNGSPLFNYMDVDPELAKVDPTSILEYIGTNTSTITSGLNLSLRYKRLSFSSSFALLLGGYKTLPNPYSAFGTNFTSTPDPLKNIDRDIINRWKKPGDELKTNIPAMASSTLLLAVPGNQGQNPISMWAQSNAMVVSNGFLRCNNMSLSYRFEAQSLGKIGISALSMSMSVSNVFVVASKRFNGFDPELNNSIMPRTYSFSLNFSF